MLSARAAMDAQSRKFVRRDLSELAPRFAQAVEAALEECRARGLDAFVYEASRTAEGQDAYDALAEQTPSRNCTAGTARSGQESWHMYGLAVDIASRLSHWDFSDAWIERVASVFKAHGCDWGGDWETRDTAHFQWGRCRRSPSREARALLESGGLAAVWREVAADVRQEAPSDFSASHVLRRGDRGPRVMHLQRKLGLHPDGVFGRETLRSVREFQRSRGLPADGIVGPLTAAAIASI